MAKFLILTALTLIFFPACRLEPDPMLLPDPWQPVEPGEGIVGMESAADQLFLQTATSLYIMGASDGRNPCLSFDSVHYRIPLSKSIVVIPAENGEYIDFYPAKNVCGGSARTRVYLSQLLPGQTVVPDLGYRRMVASDDGQFLINLRNVQYEDALFLFTVDFTDAGQTEIDTVRAKPVPVPDIEHFSEALTCEGKIYFSYVSKFLWDFHTLLLQPDGSWLDVMPDLTYSMFVLGETWYAVSFDKYFESQDQGRTWISVPVPSVGYLWSSSLYSMRYERIYGKLIGIDWYAGSRVMVIEEEPDPVLGKYWLLDNTGIENANLFRLKEWNGAVYAWTDAGIFKRSLAEFFTGKKSD